MKNNFNIPRQLINKIKQDQLVVFVGAGLSRGLGYPDWKDLVDIILGNISAREPRSETLRLALREEILSPIEVLDKIDEAAFDSVIDAFYKAINDVKPKASEIHKKIGRLSDKIITTNYDCLLENALPEFDKVIYTNTYKIANLTNTAKYIFKIHGDINEPHNCVLLTSGYNKLYSIEDKAAVFEMKKIVSDKSVLFIGFSLTDPFINHLLKYINILYSGFNPEHYVITNSDKDWPNKIIPVKVDEYADIESLIDDLILVKEEKEAAEKDIQKTLDDINDGGAIVKLSSQLDFDSPPQNKYWVGRKKELDNINNSNFKVIFITGIGGQGKSALAAHYIRSYLDTNIYEFGDWRDFKEETNRFQTKISSIIKRLYEDFDISTLEQYTPKELVDALFYYLGDRKAIFVFDNIDSYIDLEKFIPSGQFQYLFEQALSRPHNSKFIFTCRPFIREASTNFYQISLSGLSIEECEELFLMYKIPSINKIQLDELCRRSHSLTKGHPLWLNLIAGQACRGLNTVNDFIGRIENKSSFDEEDFSAILSEKILDEVWNSLNKDQKVLIRAISETVKPEKEENIKRILSSELNENHSNKALKVLKNLNLIETLSDGEIELHPLVKEYVLTKYTSTERAKYITLFVQYYDTIILVLKQKLSPNLTIKEFQNWTSKVELQINKGDFKSALICLQEISTPLLTAGYAEEYLRVAEILFNAIDWELAINQEYSYFHNQFSALSNILTQMGKYELCEGVLNKYAEFIQGKSDHYLLYCASKTYLFWYQGLFADAIDTAEEGIYLMSESGIADNHSLKHNYALALRDSKETENLKKSLSIFLLNESLDTVLDKNNVNMELQGHYYGNIGRCLEFMGRLDDALFCYYVSLKLLHKEDVDSNSNLNIGYASFWIYGVLSIQNKGKDSLYFLKYAKNCWIKSSPPRVKKIDQIWDKIRFDKSSKNEINKLSDWKIEQYCKNYIEQNIRV